jgi:hypothetical protein
MELAAEAGLPWGTVRVVDASCSWIRDFAAYRCGRVESCAGRVHTVAVPPLPGMIQPLLVDLEAANVVERVGDVRWAHAPRNSGFGRQVSYAAVSWRYCGPRSDPEFDAIVAEMTR